MTDASAPRARYRRIMRFAARHVALVWWFELVLPRLGLGALAARGRSARLQRLAQRFHALALELGGLMIKVGQFMSSRLDVLPPEITAELEGLQDEAPAVPFAGIRELAEGELGMPLAQAYTAFEQQPLAAASLGQAHRAGLNAVDTADTGLTDAIVKVQRPGIEAIVDVDLAALRRVARWLSRVHVISDRVDMPALVEEFAETSLQEIDYRHEAANAERFRECFEGDARVRVPQVVWERSTRRVLTLEDVSAIKINDIAGLRAAGIDPAAVAAEFAAVMFDQIFTHGFFHADPHPGNLFVTPRMGGADASGGPGAQWQLTFVDFGMMGEVPASARSGLRRLLIAAAARDGRGLVEGMREVGALLPSADEAVLERAMVRAFERFGGMGVAELREVDEREFRDFAAEFGELLRSMPFQLPEHFLLIARAASLTSGLCSSLDPAFNLWNAVEPYAAQLLRAESGNVVHDVAQRAIASAGLIAHLPTRLDDVLNRIEEGRLAVGAPRVERKLARLERAARRVVSAILFSGLLVAGVLLLAWNPPLGVVLMAASAVPLLHAVLAGILGRRGPD
ncbi:ABC1 kinase family protein [Agrococcus baldri]|uniref:ABC transporter n=1 Tax=Agrococcus baldri TaxID=153730 RepID=A0AA87UXU4_9MICO|nr:AarF/UbiB family protein [Agrococcus baldri]GEK80687.1 ABC transporter [Agrococcus baldri]